MCMGLGELPEGLWCPTQHPCFQVVGVRQPTRLGTEVIERFERFYRAHVERGNPKKDQVWAPLVPVAMPRQGKRSDRCDLHQEFVRKTSPRSDRDSEFVRT